MNFLKLLLAILLVSTTFSLVLVHSCSKETEDKRGEDQPKFKDVPVLVYLETQKPEIASKWKAVHAWIVEEEGYALSDMPFEKGLVKWGTNGKSCVTSPIATWEKLTQETRCIITITFDCKGNDKSHTSQCIILQ